SAAQLIGDYYAACMDTAGIEASGTKPLEPWFKKIDAIKDEASLRNMLADLHSSGIGGVFGFYSYLDQQNRTMTIANLSRAGLSLPNSDYDTKADDKSGELRNKLVAHIAKMFQLVGESADSAKKDADTIMSIEMRLAKASKSPVELRDPANYYKMMTVADADK